MRSGKFAESGPPATEMVVPTKDSLGRALCSACVSRTDAASTPLPDPRDRPDLQLFHIRRIVPTACGPTTVQFPLRGLQQAYLVAEALSPFRVEAVYYSTDNRMGSIAAIIDSYTTSDASVTVFSQGTRQSLH